MEYSMIEQNGIEQGRVEQNGIAEVPSFILKNGGGKKTIKCLFLSHLVTICTNYQPSVFLRPSLAVIIVVEACSLSGTTLNSINSGWAFFFSLFTCRCKLQLCILPMKADLASMDHTFSFSALVPKGVPCSASKAATPKPE